MDLNDKKIPDDLRDEQLIEVYRSGREEAFTILVQRYKQELYHFLVRFTGNRHSAEDVFQDTFIQVYRTLDRFETSKRFKPWLFTISANKARDHLRRSKRRATTPLSSPVQADSEGERQLMDLMQSDQILPVEVAEQREMQEMVRRAVQTLPEHLREILLLAYFHQFPYKEIATILGIPLGTVKSRLHTAVGTFADLWKRLRRQPDE